MAEDEEQRPRRGGRGGMCGANGLRKALSGRRACHACGTEGKLERWVQDLGIIPRGNREGQ